MDNKNGMAHGLNVSKAGKIQTTHKQWCPFNGKNEQQHIQVVNPVHMMNHLGNWFDLVWLYKCVSVYVYGCMTETDRYLGTIQMCAAWMR